MSNNNLNNLDDPFVSMLTQGSQGLNQGPQGHNQGSQGHNQGSQGDCFAPDAFPGAERTFGWHHDNYMQNPHVVESGFISGSNTQAGSVTGTEEDPEGNYYCRLDGQGCSTGGPGSVAASSVCDWDAIQFSEQSSVHSSASGRIDTVSAIPEFINYLADEDPVVVMSTFVAMEKFTQKDEFIQAISRSSELITSLVRHMNVCLAKLPEAVQVSLNPNSSEEEKSESCKMEAVAKCLAGIFRNTSKIREGKEVIVTSGAVGGITAFLNCKIDKLMYSSIMTLHNLLLVDNEKNQEEKSIREEVRKHIRQSGGVQSLLTILLGRDDDKLLSIVIDCLRILAQQHQETKKILLQRGGTKKLVEILKNKDRKMLIVTTTRLLKVLAVCMDNKRAIIEYDGISVLAKTLENPSNQIKTHSIWTLRNLSDAAANYPKINNLIPPLVRLLNDGDQNIGMCSAGILRNLAVFNKENKLAICNAQGIPALLSVIETYGSSKYLLEDAVSTLRLITSGHDAAQTAQNVLLQPDQRALAILIRQMEIHMACSDNPVKMPHWPSVKALLFLFRNLAQRMDNHEALRKENLVFMIRDLFGFVVNGFLDTNVAVDKVHPLDTMDFFVGFFLNIAKNEANRPLLRNPNFIDYLAAIAYFSPAESHQKLVSATMLELSMDEYCCFLMLRSEKVKESLAKLDSLGNDKAAESLRGIMLNLSQLQKDGNRLAHLDQQFMQGQRRRPNNGVNPGMVEMNPSMNPGPPPPQFGAGYAGPLPQQVPYQQQPQQVGFGGPPGDFPAGDLLNLDELMSPGNNDLFDEAMMS